MGLYRIHDLPSSERPRERMRSQGAEALSSCELLALITGTGAQGISAVDLSRKILKHFDNSLLNLSTATLDELCEIHGIGEAKSTSIRAVFTLARRLQGQLGEQRFKVSAPESIADYMRPLLTGKKQEEFHVIMLDTKNCIIKSLMISRGLLDRSHVHPREVFRAAVKCAAARLILAHNHPSGDPTPSQKDLDITAELVKSGNIIGIKVIDHIIIGSKNGKYTQDFVSMRLSGVFPEVDD